MLVRRAIHCAQNAKPLAAAVAVAALLAAAPAQGASDGPLGSSSSGAVVLNAAVPNLVQISLLDDVNLGAWAGATLTAFEDFCVFSSTRAYRVTATSANGAGNQFRLDNAGTALRYVVRWYDSNNVQQNLRNNRRSRVFTATTNSVNCISGTNTRARIRVRNAWASAAPAGTYSDTLTLLVEPQ